VTRWIGDGAPWDEERTRAGIRAMEALWEAERFGFCAAGIGWRLGRRHWGHGHATEAARASLRHAFRTRGLGRVLGLVQSGDTASEHVMHKPGMRMEPGIIASNTGRPLRIYAITAAEYAAAGG
jgi:RimJ/RimL family protein N-acetyltransferase